MSPLPEEDREIIQELLGRVDAIESAVITIIQVLDEEMKKRLLFVLNDAARIHLLDPPPLDHLTYRHVNDALERLFRFMRMALRDLDG